MQTLHAEVVGRLFARLSGIYGNRFTGQFANGNPVQIGKDASGQPVMGDVGVESAKSVWAEELGGFAGDLGAIAYGLQNLDPKFPPSALELRDLCRKAPRKPEPAKDDPYPLLGYTATEEDIAEAKRRMRRMDLTADRDPLDWARRPVSPIAVRVVIDTAKRDSRFKAIVADLEAAGVIDPEGRTVKLWDRSLKQFVPFGGAR